jgi:diphthine synthase
MLYLVGLGLNKKGISKEGLEIVGRCKKVYLENYTVDFPYSLGEIAEIVGKKVEAADREFVEGLSIVDEAKKKDIALLVYGSPLTATTHITIIKECKETGVKCKVIYSASILDAVAESGLQLYKFGKITSMPAWKKSYSPTSFMEVVKENKSIKAHSLILIDIGLNFSEALKQLEESAKEQEISLKKLIVCQALGTKRSKVLYRGVEEFREFKGVKKPYCIIIPEKLHFVENEFLESFG